MLNPERSIIFEFFRKKLEENNGEVPIWKLYREFGAPPFGLTKEILTLSLLCFVRYGDPSVEIRLKDDHRQPIRASKITSFNVPQVEWRGRFEEDFDVLGRSTEISWNDVLPLARVIAPEQELKIATKPEGILEQERRLLLSLRSIREKIPQVTMNLKTLSSGFGQKLAKLECIDNIEKICAVENYADFNEAVVGVFESDVAAFRVDVGVFRNLVNLSDQGTVLLTMRSYVDDAILPEEKTDLVKSKDSIRDKLDLESFLADMSRLEEVKEQFEGFKRRYGPLYQIHHRDYYVSVKKTREQLNGIGGKVDAIARLNTLNLNLPTSKAGYYELLARMKKCGLPDPVPVDTSSICKGCKLTLIEKHDANEVNSFVKKVDESLKLGMNRLAKVVTKPILDLDKEKKLGELMKTIKSNDSSRFVKVLTDPMIEYLLRLSEECNIETIRVSLSKFAQKYALVEEDCVEEVVEAFREVLLTEVEKAKKGKPGKKIRIALGE